MGRPVNKRYFGKPADADDNVLYPLTGDTFFNVTLAVQVESNAETDSGYILQQRSTTRFLVNDLNTGTKRTPSGAGTGNVGICKLVDKAAGSLAANEIVLVGYVTGVGGSPVRIKKLYNRTCRDFNNTRYKWTIQNDSSVTALILTAI
jgi:hypothetical protein